MNVNKHLWHILSFDKWYNEFFLPFIHAHHDHEEIISFPFWAKLEGIDAPQKQTQDHKTLLKDLNEISTLSKEILDVASLTFTSPSRSSESSSLITIKCDELKVKWDSSMQHMFDHLSEEETFWPPIYEKHGEKFVKEDTNNILNHGFQTKGIEHEAFKNTFCSVLTAVGTTLNKSKGKYGQLIFTQLPYASTEFSANFHNELPMVPKLLIFPSWLDKYERYCVLLDSINAEVDRSEELFSSQSGCRCVIS